MVQALNLNAGITYTISSEGEAYCSSLASEYASEYRKNAKQVIKSIFGKSERELISGINKLSTKSLMKEGASE